MGAGLEAALRERRMMEDAVARRLAWEGKGQPPPLPPGLKLMPEPVMQANAAVRAAANTTTQGMADNIAAGLDAFFQPGGLGRLPERYQTNLRAEHNANLYDRRFRPEAYWAGVAGGTAMALRGGGRFQVAGPIKPLRGATGMSTRDYVAAAAGGAVSSIGEQQAVDTLTGHRSTVGDYIGAGLGGAAGGVGAKYGPKTGGAVNGAVTSVAQDLLNLRPVSIERAAQAASAGGLVAGRVGLAEAKRVQALPPNAKGRVGETLGRIRSEVNGYRLEPNLPRVRLPSGRYTKPDGRSGGIVFEYKNGRSADHTTPQREHKRLLGDRFITYHFQPETFGKILSVPAGAGTVQAALWLSNQLRSQTEEKRRQLTR